MPKKFKVLQGPPAVGALPSETGSGSVPAPCSVVPSSRHVIEKKLLTALEEEGNVAILANSEDLKLMIEALTSYASDHRTSLKSEARMRSLAADLRQLQRAAFPLNAQAEP